MLETASLLPLREKDRMKGVCISSIGYFGYEQMKRNRAPSFMSGRSLSGVLGICLPDGLDEPLRRFFGADAKHVRNPSHQALIAAGLPQASQAPQRNRHAVLILEFPEKV
jgi:hypothetical protein